MSFDAIHWAMSQPVGHSSAKFVLVALANCADDDGNCWPSVASLAACTEQDRKTVIANLKRLVEAGWICDTKERKGATGQVCVYRLNRTKNGTVKEGQKRDSLEDQTVPFFPSNSTAFPTKDSQISLLRLPKTGHGTYQEPISEPINEQKEPRKRVSVDWVADLASRGVCRDVAESWLKVRKEKSAAVTVIAVDGIAREALKAGITLEEAMRIGCERGWAAFRADWLKDDVKARAGPKTPKPENFDLIDYGTGGRL